MMTVRRDAMRRGLRHPLELEREVYTFMIRSTCTKDSNELVTEYQSITQRVETTSVP